MTTLPRRVTVGPVPTTGPMLDRLLWRTDRTTRLTITDALHEAASGYGMAVDFEDDGPVFYEVEVEFIGRSVALGGLCALVNDAIRDHFEGYGLRRPACLPTTITLSAMSAGTFDQALAYLMGWVGVATGED